MSKVPNALHKVVMYIMCKDSQVCYLVNYRNSIFTENVINKILPIITLEDNTLVNRKLYNKINLLIILDNITIANSDIIKVLLKENVLNYVINNVGLNIGSYSMFLSSISLFVGYFSQLTYLKNESEVIELFSIFYKVQPKIKTLLSRKVEYNSKDLVFNDFLFIARYIDEVLDEGFSKLSDYYIIETQKYINWSDNWVRFKCNNTNSFSDYLFQNINFETKKICFELKQFNFNNISSHIRKKVKRLIFELTNYCDGFYVTPVLLSNKQEQSIVKLMDYISNFKSDKNFKLELVDVNVKKSYKVQLLASIKITYKNVVYKINLERRKYLLFLSLSPALCGVYRISFYGIDDFKHLLLEILTDYKIRIHHIENNYCCL